MVSSRADEARIEAAVSIARRLVADAATREEHLPSRDRRRRQRLRALVTNPGAAAFVASLTDEVPRIREPRAAARRLRALVGEARLDGFSRADRLALRLAGHLAPRVPRVIVPLVVARLRREALVAIVAADDRAFTRHLRRRRAEGFTCNINVLGEAIVGDGEARRRLDTVIALLRRPDVDYVSVKISAICARISALAFDDSVERISAALRELFAAAASSGVFVNLDMEEYRDVELTIAAFERVLDEPPLNHLDAGIALQAYLPDSLDAARRVAEWAVRRRDLGGGRIKIRIVKGANMAMELVDAEIHGWRPAPFPTKAEVDANYKAILDLLLEPRFDDAVRIGVATHNLFDAAWAQVLAAEMAAAGRPARVEPEMLEGMAPAQAAALRARAGKLVLYTPVVSRRDFPAAVAYLVRRLDENTAPGNFLAHVFDLANDEWAFEVQRQAFREAVLARGNVDGSSRRHRASPPAGADGPDIAVEAGAPSFANAADTDWTDPARRRAIAAALAAPPDRRAALPARPPTVADVDDALRTSTGAPWSRVPAVQRAELLERVAAMLEQSRDLLLATMARDAAKTIAEGDPEVSEAIDLARYDAHCARSLVTIEGARASAVGPVVVAPPWNFPLSIPAGGVLAALAAGNPVILKPAPQARATSALLVALCHAAGIPADALQLVAADDDEAGAHLITHRDVAAVILTGAWATAQTFLDWRPDLALHAETSGKNAIVVTACADLDRAIADIVQSAFGHAGQKCSAASVLIAEAVLYDDAAFLARLRDAAATMRVGPATDPATDVGPLIEPPRPELRRALTELDPGETWLLRPECRSADGLCWSPGIRTGVRRDSWFARTECFGPVLGVIRADDLDDALAILADSEFGLTSGLQSLDPAEITRWSQRAAAGNLYVNRGITGAIVRRQPFGGWKHSSVGPTAKTGGPNYVATLCRWEDTGTPLAEVETRFARWMTSVGTVDHDPSGLAAERNTFRYRRLSGGVACRVGTATSERDRALIAAAARVSATRLVLSDAADEPASHFAERLAGLGVDRLRVLGDDADADGFPIRRAAHRAGIVVDTSDPVGAPEVELPRWLREQSLSITAHRYGRVPRRSVPRPPRSALSRSTSAASVTRSSTGHPSSTLARTPRRWATIRR